MTPGSVDGRKSAGGGTAGATDAAAPVLVLAVGNTLLGDDGVGQALLDRLREFDWPAEVELLDGGTQGLALLGRLAGRRALVVLDAVALAAEPGTVHTLREWKKAGVRAGTAHESNVGELLQAAILLGDCPDRVAVIGIEPASLATGIGLSEAVAGAIPAAVEVARRVIEEVL